MTTTMTTKKKKKKKKSCCLPKKKKSLRFRARQSDLLPLLLELRFLGCHYLLVKLPATTETFPHFDLLLLLLSLLYFDSLTQPFLWAIR